MKLSNDDLYKIEQVKAILENEYRNTNTHSHLARRVSTNESKLRKGFKYVNNKTIYEYLIGVRIEKAKEMLKTTDEPVKAIAIKVGYDVSNLVKQFKKMTGMAPLQWITMEKNTYTRQTPHLYPVTKKNRIRHEFNRNRQLSICNLPMFVIKQGTFYYIFALLQTLGNL
jgi:AraC-like DNA-binding protein